MFEQHVISRGGDVPWPARSPGVSACGYFLWGYLKSKIFISKPRTTAGLKQIIKGRIRGDLGLDDSSGDGKSWSKTQAVFLEMVGDIWVTYFSKLKMVCTEFSSDNNFYKKNGETSLCYFILKTVSIFCRTLY